MRRGLSPSVVLAVAVFVAVALVVGAGTAAGLGTNAGGVDGAFSVDDSTGVAETSAECESEADNDLIGCWNGIHHTDDPEADFGIDPDDGTDDMSEEQLEALTNLQMARVEWIRERPFESAVPVEVVSREALADEGIGGAREPGFHRWNDQIWKALFVIGEDESSEETIDAIFSGSVAGFYSASDERIVLVVEDEDTLRISPGTLLHELGHAMQDQYEDLSDPRFNGATQDADLAGNGIIEGEVVYMEKVYAERCEEEWTCAPEPESVVDTTGESEPNLGVLITVLQPYSDGAPYVDELIEAGGWEAVDELMAEPPTTTRETIHREPFESTPIEFTDTAEGDWETYGNLGVDGADTVGEASMFVSLWYQSSRYDAGVMEHNDLFDTNHPYQDYNYSHPATNGWVNDELYPYRNDAGDESRDGYVWVIEWETAADAEEFHDAYLQVLDAPGRNVELRDNGIHQVRGGEFRGAYGIERDGTTLTIAHALNPEEVFELRPDIELDQPETNGNDDFDDITPPGTVDFGEETTPSTDSDWEDEPVDPVDEDVPGFGVVAVLVALVTTLALALRGAEP